MQRQAVELGRCRRCARGSGGGGARRSAPRAGSARGTPGRRRDARRAPSARPDGRALVPAGVDDRHAAAAELAVDAVAAQWCLCLVAVAVPVTRAGARAVREGPDEVRWRLRRGRRRRLHDRDARQADGRLGGERLHATQQRLLKGCRDPVAIHERDRLRAQLGNVAALAAGVLAGDPLRERDEARGVRALEVGEELWPQPARPALSTAMTTIRLTTEPFAGFPGRPELNPDRQAGREPDRQSELADLCLRRADVVVDTAEGRGLVVDEQPRRARIAVARLAD